MRRPAQQPGRPAILRLSPPVSSKANDTERSRRAEVGRYAVDTSHLPCYCGSRLSPALPPTGQSLLTKPERSPLAARLSYRQEVGDGRQQKASAGARKLLSETTC